MTPRPSFSARRVLRALLALAVPGFVLGLWAFWLEPSSLRVREHELALPHWPSEHDGLRVAVLADLHVGSAWYGVRQLREVVRATNEAKPDLILIAGDLVSHGSGPEGGVAELPEAFAPILSELRARMGVWAVLGNHDGWFDAERVRDAMTKAGIDVLEDRAVRLEVPPHRKGPPIWLVGISDLWTGEHDLEGALAQVPSRDGDAAPVILALTHNPDLFVGIPPRVALTLAGHTHGGQVRIPLLGSPVVPSAYGQRYALGHIVEEGRHLFVTSGLGTSILPVRFLVPPEVSILRLRKGPHPD